MWFNILPSYLIVTASMAGPGFALWGLHWLFLGNHHRRSLTERWDRHLYQRDWRLTGSPYKVAGLETLPDGDGKKQ